MDIMIEFINKIRRRPTMYIGENNIDKLHLFISGYWARQKEVYPEYRSDFEHFGTFLGLDSGMGWSSWILDKTGSQSEAMDFFFDKIDEFISLLDQIKAQLEVAWTDSLGDNSYMRHQCIHHQIEKHTATVTSIHMPPYRLSYTPKCMIKIIPTDPHLVFDVAIQNGITRKIYETLLHLKSDTANNKIFSRFSTYPDFMDCGISLKSIACPHCYAPLSFQWWGAAMDNASVSQFTNLSAITPHAAAQMSR